MLALIHRVPDPRWAHEPWQCPNEKVVVQVSAKCKEEVSSSAQKRCSNPHSSVNAVNRANSVGTVDSSRFEATPLRTRDNKISDCKLERAASLKSQVDQRHHAPQLRRQRAKDSISSQVTVQDKKAVRFQRREAGEAPTELSVASVSPDPWGSSRRFEPQSTAFQSSTNKQSNTN